MACRQHATWVVRDEAQSRRGRNNRKRGNGAELDVARAIGGRKVGPLGHPWDVEVPGYARLQVKKLARWPSVAAVLAWLDAIPVADPLRGVVVVQAAGQGKRGRRVVLFDFDEYVRWHGRQP